MATCSNYYCDQNLYFDGNYELYFLSYFSNLIIKYENIGISGIFRIYTEFKFNYNKLQKNNSANVRLIKI